MYVDKDSDPNTLLGRNLTVGLLDHVGKAIVTGFYDSKSFPTEAQLADQYKVSRSVTREAVKMLTAKGLLTARPRQGTVIQATRHWNLLDKDVLRWLLERKFSLQLLRQFTELRVSIEPKAAELASGSAGYDDLQRIKKAFDRMVLADGGEGDPTEADIDFHVAILKASGNPFFWRLKPLITNALHLSIQLTNKISGHMADIHAHEAILIAIEKGDAAAARKASEDILLESLNFIEKAQAD